MEQESIEEMYKENFEIVYKYLVYLTHDLQISEELTQETFLKAIKNNAIEKRLRRLAIKIVISTFENLKL